MKEPVFLEVDDVLAIHADQIERYGGDTGLRDLSLLQSAVAMPRATFAGQFLHPTIHEMAAAYLFHLVKNHPFVDGNKRAALAATIAFLALNDLWLDADPDELANLVVAAASGTVGKAQVAVFLQPRTVPFTS